MPTFRVHYADGVKSDVDAATAEQARKAAKKGEPPVPILKVKLVKENA